jgi:23S rRNA (pseudouridine1915-N3)-methyltransferase
VLASMRIVALSVGKKHEEDYRSAILDFSRRIGRYADFEWVIVVPSKAQTAPEDVIRAEEGNKILTHLTNRDFVILLDERGANISSPELADKIQKAGNEEGLRIVCIIGGAFGVSPEVRSRANFVWSLSKLVFPHQIARLLLAEQIYRALTILKGEKYHHE